MLLVFPFYAAYRKKLWITLGLASYGLLAVLPVWMLPSISAKLQGEDASLGASVSGFLLKGIYRMVNAPFAAISSSMGDKFALGISTKILPVALLSYIGFQLFRFYRDAYVAEQLDPASAIDKTAKENSDANDPRKVRDARIPEVLGTVISAPTSAKKAPDVNNHGQVRRPEPPVVDDATVKVPRVGDVNLKSKPDTDDTQVIRLGPPK